VILLSFCNREKEYIKKWKGTLIVEKITLGYFSVVNNVLCIRTEYLKAARLQIHAD
jgi:hypothetical protein